MNQLFLCTIFSFFLLGQTFHINGLNNIKGIFNQRSISMTDKVDCLIIGSGLSGCSAAYYLQKKGLNICVAEERNVTGGNILSKTGIT